VRDIPDVISLMGMGAPFIRPRTESDYWMYATLFSTTCLVATDEGRVAGAIMAFRSQDTPSEIYVQDLMTHPDHRRTGVARSLTAAVADRGRAWGCQSIFLTSEPENSTAHATWLRLGFVNRGGGVMVGDVHVVTDFKGPGKHRAVYDLKLA
jgi:GNAT superfamily N-acetyltransferase